MNYCEYMTVQQNYLNRLKDNYQRELEHMPKGKLIKVVSRGKTYYYEENDGKRKPIKEDTEIETFRRKEQLERQIYKIEHNILVLDKALRNYIPLTPLDSFWETLKSEQNPYHPNNRQNLYKGIFYRSKSEMTIAMFLTSYELPFKYEVEVKISESKSRYPDFCIKRPKDKKVIYWEHCGLISKETYQQDLFYKLRDYHSVGIDLWDNLILTFDQYDGGLDADTIDRVIQMFFLDHKDVMKS